MHSLKKNIHVKIISIIVAIALVFTMCPYTLKNQAVALENANASSSGESFVLDADPYAGLQAMHRLYNPNSGEHFYTASTDEKNNLVTVGWRYEGVGWIAPKKSNTPVYRLYNPNAGDHHYTTSKDEHDSLASIGWRSENIGWYSDDQKRVPLYRQYNPNAQAGAHNFTTSLDENNWLVSLGWKAEGIGWYGVSTALDIDFTSMAVVDTSDKTYNGTQIKPSASVTGLKLNTDYTVAYGENKNAGTGTITITGKGTYSGSKTYNFKINKAKVTVSGIAAEDKEYDGNTNATLKYDNVKFAGRIGSDNLSVTATGAFENSAVGYGKKVNITNLVLGGATVNNYELAATGQQTEATANITFVDETLSNITLDIPEEGYTYDGTAKEPKVLGLPADASASNYTFKYENNINAGENTAKVTVTYTNGSVTVPREIYFSIAKVEVTVSGITAENKAYDGTTDATLKFDSAILAGKVETDNLIVTATGKFDSKDVGTGKTVTFSDLALTGDVAGNYELASDGQQTSTTADITIKQLSEDELNSIVLSLPDEGYAYDTKAKTPEVTGLSSVATQDDYEVKYLGNVNAGKNTARVTVTFSGKNISGSKELYFSINKAKVKVKGIKAENKVFDDTTNATLNYDDVVFEGLYDGDALSVKGTGTFLTSAVDTNKTVKITELTLAGPSVGNYELAAEGQQTTAIADITSDDDVLNNITIEIPEEGYTYDGTPKEPQVKGLPTDANRDSYTVEYFKNINAGENTANVTVTYNNGTTSVPREFWFSIAKAKLTISGITAENKVYDGTTKATLRFDNLIKGGKIESDVFTLRATGTFDSKDVGARTVTISNVYLEGVDAANYEFAETGQQTSTTASITARTLNSEEVDAIALSLPAEGYAYDKEEKKPQVSGLPSAVQPDDYTVAYSDNINASTADKQAKATISFNGNNIIGDTKELNFPIAKAKIAVNGITAENKVYDGTTDATVRCENATLTGKVEGEDVSVTANGKFTSKNVGQGKTVLLSDLDLTGTAIANYELATADQQTSTTADITVKTLTDEELDAIALDLHGEEYVYDKTEKKPEVVGLPAEAQATDYTITYTNNVNAGENTAKASVVFVGINISGSKELTFSIAKAKVTVSGITAEDKAYDGTMDATLDCDGATLSGKVGSDNLAVTATGTFDSKDVGRDKTVFVSDFALSGDAVTNYELASEGQQALTTANINVRALSQEELDAITLSLPDEGYVYDGQEKKPEIIGLPELATDADYEITYSDNKCAGDNTAAVRVTFNGNISGFKRFPFSIAKREVTVSGITADSREYDGTTDVTIHPENATLAGKIEGDDLLITAEGAFESVAIDNDKVVNLNVELTGTSAGNYVLSEDSQKTAKANITYENDVLSSITLNLPANGYTYDGQEKKPEVIGLPTDASVASYEVAWSNNVNAGENTAKVTVTFTDGEGIQIPRELLFSIAKVKVTVSGIEANNKVYDGTTDATLNYANAQLEGRVEGDALMATATGTFDSKDVGTGKDVAISEIVLSGEKAGNYELAETGQQASATADITQKTLSTEEIEGLALSLPEEAYVYDGTEKKPEVTGLPTAVQTDDFTLTYSDNTNATTAEKLAKATISFNGPNIAEASKELTFSIAKAQITVSGIEAVNKDYDGTAEATLVYDGATLTGKIGSDDLSVTAKGAFDSKDVGEGKTVTITDLALTGDAVGNYELAEDGQQTSATANIIVKALTQDELDKIVLSLPEEGYTYDKEEKRPSVAGLPTEATAEDYDVYYSGNVNAGESTAKATVVFNGNSISGSKELYFSIAKAQVTVSGITADDKVYDGTTNATVHCEDVKFAGKLDGDDLLVTATGKFESKDAGDKNVNLTDLTLAGDAVGDYELADSGQQTVATAKISVKTLTQDELDAITLSMPEGGYVYNATYITPEVLGIPSEAQEDDYLITYTDNKNAGINKAKATITFNKTAENGLSGNIEGSEKQFAFSIELAALTVSGITANDKVYDGNTTVTLNIDDLQLEGVCGDDKLSVVVEGGAFANSAVGTDKKVYVHYYVIGDNIANYKYSDASQSTTTASITCDDDVLNGISLNLPANGYSYDGQEKEPEVVGLPTDETRDSYEVEYANNIYPGKAKATVTFDDGAGTKIPIELSFTIAKAKITVSGITASDKVYDGTADASLNAFEATIAGKVHGDSLFVSATGKFDSKDAWTNKTVTISDYTMYGGDIDYYEFAETGQQTYTIASITPRTIGIYEVEAFKLSLPDEGYVYDKTEKMPSVSSVLDYVMPDDYTVKYDNNVNASTPDNLAKATISFDSGNVIARTTEFTFSIAKAEVTVSGIEAENKVYDGTNDATLNYSNVELTGKIDGDDLSVFATGAFGDKSVGEGKTVTLTDLDLSGDAVNNYELAAEGQQTTATADITAKTLTDEELFEINLSLPDDGYVYDKTEKTPSVTGLPSEAKEGDYTIAYTNNVNAGGNTAKATVTFNENISGKKEFAFSIAPKEVTVTGVSIKDRGYAKGDRSVPLDGSATFAEGDIIDGDNVFVNTDADGEYADDAAADGKEVTLAVTLAGADAQNYTVKDATMTLTGNILSTIKFDTNCAQTIDDEYVHVGTALGVDNVTAKLTDRVGLTKEGWYANAACYGEKWDFADDVVYGNTITLYANWTPTDGVADGNESYWIGPAYNYISNGKNEVARTVSNDASDTSKERYNYVSEEWNVLKSSTEIKEDIETMKNGTDEEKESVIQEYQTIMQDDRYHLYTKYSGGESEVAVDGTSTDAKNGYAEFRIIEVSGDGCHKLHDGQTRDGSIITFMATHVLPTAYTMSTDGSSTNVGGWASTNVYTQLQEEGAIYSKFNENFVSDVAVVPNEYNTGDGAGQATEPETVETKFWIPSFREIAGASDQSGIAPTTEGVQYEWFSERGVDSGLDSGASNGMLQFKTRAGQTAGSSSGADSNWCFRSPWVNNSTSFCGVNGKGALASCDSATYGGVAPCFAFGLDYYNITFDLNAPSNTTATIGGTDTTKSLRVRENSVLTSEDVPADSSVKCSDSTYVFAGWAATPGAGTDEASKNSDLVAKKEKVTDKKTYYAVWKDTNTSAGFWMSSINTTGTKASDFTSNANYKSQKQILADVSVLRAGKSNATYARAFEKWQEYFTKELKLYATYSGGASAKSKDGYTSDLNGLVEFWILEVSGEEGHLNKSGDASSKDGSVLSFMATHALPTAYAMNSSETSSGGWNSCAVRGKLRSGGEIYNNFPSDLRNNIKQVKKLTVKDDTGDSFTAPTQTTTDLFWLMSYRELVATGNFVRDASPNEGTTYQLCNKKKIDGETENNSVIGAMCRTRAGRSPGNLWFSSPTTGVTWLRAPYASWGFRAIAYTPVQPGVVDYHWQADECMGVAPCFCF